MNKKILSRKYEIKREIGRGGMGVIYEALHKTLNRTVAIKVLHAQYAGDSAFLKRFQREARAMARLDHANIIRVFDVGEDEGFHYIVMEYFPGKDLKQVILERETLSQHETLSITLQITKALSYAHAHGIIHRDIKPGNIMINKAGLVKIADFGIAAATDEVSVTVTGHVIGTPEYMSVEQARGEALDSRSDLYSLGMVVYEMLTGRTSFSGISKMAILGKLVYEKKEYDLVFQDHILPSIQTLIRTLLKKNKDERISDTTTLVNLLNKASSELQTKISTAETLDETRFAEIPLSEEKSPKEIKMGTEEEEDALETVMFHKTPPEISPVSPSSPKQSRRTSGQKHFQTPKKTPPGQSKKPFPVKPTSKKDRLRIGMIIAGLAILSIGIAYYLSVMEPPSTVTPISSPADEIQTIEQSLQEIQTKLKQSQRKADAGNAGRWAKEIYEEASDFENRGKDQLEAAKIFMRKGQSEDAEVRLQKVLILLGQAHDGFLKAREKAQINKVQSEKLKIEQEKKAQQKARAEAEHFKKARLKAEAERRKQEALALAAQEKLKQSRAKAKGKKEKRAREAAEAEQDRKKREAQTRAEQEKRRQKKVQAEKEQQKQAEIERQRLAQEKAKAEKEALSSSVTNMKYLGGQLAKLKAAYEKKDLVELQNLTQISEKRSQFLKQIFDNYKIVKVDVSKLSAVGNKAKATISIQELTSFDGNRVLPSKQWKNAELRFQKKEGVWGKAKW